MIRQHLQKHCIQPETCNSFDLVAYGPLFPEAEDMPQHRERRDKVAALERELADALAKVGYDVLNKVISNQQVDNNLWSTVHEAFEVHFPRMVSGRSRS